MEFQKYIKEEFDKINRKLDRLNAITQSLPVTHNTNLGGWLTQEQTKELLQKGTTSLWQLRKDGFIRFSKIGGHNYYCRESILNYLEKKANKK